MFKSGKPISQGEVLFWMKKYAPQGVLDNIGNGFEEVEITESRLIVGHSETGHHHVLEPVSKAIPISQAVVSLIKDATDMWMELKLAEPCVLLHLREHDQHQALTLPAGEYIRGLRQEQTPDGWQRVLD